MKAIFTKTHFTNRIIWILLAWFTLYEILAGLATMGCEDLLRMLFKYPSGALSFVLTYYTPRLGSCLLFVLVCLVLKKNRFLLEGVKPVKGSMRMLGIGLLLGFLTNFFCILCALIHGDIKLYCDFSASLIPFLLFAFISTFFQSASEELWCRSFLYDRINVHYPLWVGIVINGVLFGVMHLGNPGVSALAIADLIFCGISYSLLRWYTGSIWACFGIHTMWNVTQNFIFGLPNSGLVSEASVFHLGAANGISNWIYSYEFGVEGAFPAVFIDLVLGGVILWAAWKEGRLGELLKSRESRGLAPVPAPKEAPVVEISEEK